MLVARVFAQMLLQMAAARALRVPRIQHLQLKNTTIQSVAEQPPIQSCMGTHHFGAHNAVFCSHNVIAHVMTESEQRCSEAFPAAMAVVVTRMLRSMARHASKVESRQAGGAHLDDDVGGVDDLVQLPPDALALPLAQHRLPRRVARPEVVRNAVALLLVVPGSCDGRLCLKLLTMCSCPPEQHMDYLDRRGPRSSQRQAYSRRSKRLPG